MTDQNLVRIFVGTVMNADYLKSVLHKNRIECIVRNLLQESALAGFAAASSDNAASVFVEEQDLEKAEEIVFLLFEQTEDEEVEGEEESLWEHL